MQINNIIKWYDYYAIMDKYNLLVLNNINKDLENCILNTTPKELLKLPKKQILNGRNKMPVVNINGVDVIIKQYKHGGFAGGFTGSNYLSPQRFIDELIAISVLNNVAIPKYYALYISKGILKKAFAVIEYVPNSITLYDLIKQNKLNEIIVNNIALGIVNIEKSNVIHSDLNVRNIIVANDKPYFLDFDKPKLNVNFDDCFGIMPARLFRSLKKEFPKKDAFLSNFARTYLQYRNEISNTQKYNTPTNLKNICIKQNRFH